MIKIDEQEYLFTEKNYTYSKKYIYFRPVTMAL